MSESELRLRCWVRDFGHTSQRPFVADLKALLEERAADEARIAELEALVAEQRQLINELNDDMLSERGML